MIINKYIYVYNNKYILYIYVYIFNPYIYLYIYIYLILYIYISNPWKILFCNLRFYEVYNNIYQAVKKME